MLPIYNGTLISSQSDLNITSLNLIHAGKAIKFQIKNECNTQRINSHQYTKLITHNILFNKPLISGLTETPNHASHNIIFKPFSVH